ncbi:MAG: transposase [Ruminococcus sp.]|nr:transposase [Ruminococcus sp.]
MDLPKRKNIRLKEYDYSSPGVYFVTVCASERKKYFWNSEKCVVPVLKYDEVVLSEMGKEVETAINGITEYYQNVSVDKFVIMPNHIHMMIRINSTEDGRPMVVPTQFMI